MTCKGGCGSVTCAAPCRPVQWYPSIPDTSGPKGTVLITKVSSSGVEYVKNIHTMTKHGESLVPQ